MQQKLFMSSYHSSPRGISCLGYSYSVVASNLMDPKNIVFSMLHLHCAPLVGACHTCHFCLSCALPILQVLG